MKSPLLATKFHQPRFQQGRVVARPRLIQRLNDGLAAGRGLTLISAPAGFGKTTAASEWLHTLDLPSAWLSLERQDDDPVRFFAYFLAALQKVDEGIGREIESVLQSGQLPPLEALSTLLINDILELPGRFLLVLDDFQVIQDRAILEVLERLIANQPLKMHLVLVTREDPNLPLARLRANDQLTEVRAADLRFSTDETGHFLSEMMGLSLSDDDIAALENRTEGWVAGLQLAGLSMRSRPDPSVFIANLSGSHRYILSYLTEEVLDQQPESIRGFLLKTSILDKLCGDLCDAVTEDAGGQALLERLYASNLFLVPLDDEGQWYRYHHLFADLLRARQGRFSPEQASQMHWRASRWYESANMPNEAVGHALSAGDYASAVQLIEAHALEMVLKGYAKTVESWMQAVPVEWHSHSPRANLAFAWMHLLRGSTSSIPPYLGQADLAISQAESGPGSDQQAVTALRAEWLALQANLLNTQGRPKEGLQMAEQALELAHPQNDYVRGSAYLGLGGAYRQIGDYDRSVDAYQSAAQASRKAGNLVAELLAVSNLALMAIQHGRLRFAVEAATPVLERIERSGVMPPPISGVIYGVLGFIYYEWNRLELARQYYLRSLHLGNLSGHNASVIYTGVAMARLSLIEGDPEAAGQAAQRAASLLALGAPAWLKPEVAQQQVRIFLAQRDVQSAEAVLGSFGLSPDGPVPPPLEPVYLAYLRLLLYRNQDLLQGIELAAHMIASSELGGRYGVLLQALLLRAQLHSAIGNEFAGLADLARALELAEPQGYIRMFVDEGPVMAALLRQVQDRFEVKAYIAGLLEAFEKGAAPVGVGGPVESEPVKSHGTDLRTGVPEAELIEPLKEPLIEPLTERELEVLRLIAVGMKYEEIAERLVITLNTVRFHVKGIYSKLNVNNRTRAVQTAQELRLL